MIFNQCFVTLLRFCINETLRKNGKETHLVVFCMDEIENLGNCLRFLNGQNVGKEEFRKGFECTEWKNRHDCGGFRIGVIRV